MSKKPELDNITLPVYELLTKETREAIASAIQADKDILSQLEIDEEQEFIGFPDGIIPLRIKTSDNKYYYMNYNSMKLLDSTGNDSGVTPGWSQSHLNLRDISSLDDYEIIAIDYILVSGESLPSPLNAYALYHPITSAGTKLYKHSISLNNPNVTNLGGGQPFKLKIINNVSTPLTAKLTDNVLLFIEDQNSYFVDYNIKYKITLIRYAGPSPIIRFIGTKTSDSVFSFYDVTLDVSNTTNFSDTVTEL